MEFLETYGELTAAVTLGAIVGVAAQRTNFCARRALADSFAGVSRLYLMGFGVAILVAIAATQTLLLTTSLDLSDVVALRGQVPIVGLTLGALLFGIGMMLAGGCPHRLLIRTGQGQLNALTLLLILIFTVMATRDGVLSPLRAWLSESLVTIEQPRFASVLPFGDGWLIPAIASLAAATLGLRALRSPSQGARGLIIASLVIGLCCAGSWYFSVALADEFELPTPHPLSYIAPTQELARFVAMSEMGFSLKFGTALVIGTCLGAAIGSALGGSGQTRRNVLTLDGRAVTGAVLMGFGGVLAQGCTFGHGLSGLSVLSLSSVWVLIWMTVGAWLGYRWLHRTAFVDEQLPTSASQV